MRPARQCFKTNNPIGDDINLQLVDDGQFLDLKRIVQIGTNREFTAKEFVQCLCVEPIGIVPYLLGDT